MVREQLHGSWFAGSMCLHVTARHHQVVLSDHLRWIERHYELLILKLIVTLLLKHLLVGHLQGEEV